MTLPEWERWIKMNLIDPLLSECREVVLLRIAINMLDKVDGLEKDYKLQLMDDLQRTLHARRYPF